ncbi:MAG TPA: carboxymuconolactone decarboxylase family protein [Candidatus Binatia bacterium]
MAKEAEFFNVKYREGSLDAKTAQLILMAVNFAIGHEHGAKLHLSKARENGATEDEIQEAVVYCMRPVAAKVRNFAKEIIAK